MERLELSKPGLKNLSRDRFAFIPISSGRTSVWRPHSVVSVKLKFAGHSRCGRGESNSQDARFKRAMSACCITPAHSLLHASRFTRHKLVAESGVAPDDLLVMSQPSLVPAPSPHQEHAVRVELTISGFADRRLNQLGYACHKFLELRAGIEPALSPWQGDVIPLDQRSACEFQISNLRFEIARILKLWCWRKESNLHQTGFEPVASAGWATPARFHKTFFEAAFSRYISMCR